MPHEKSQGFVSSGIEVGRTPRSKHDQRSDHLKANTVTMGKNAPLQAEGAVGDITVRDVSMIGIRCYIKTNSGWLDINSLIATFKTNWIDMNLINSWATDTTYGTPQYCKDQNGFVHLRGGVDTGSISADITTLPEGFRPNFEQRRLVSRLVNASIYIQQIRIDTFGVIKRVYASIINLDDTVQADTTAEVCFDGISFFAQQNITSIGAGSTANPNTEQFPGGFPVH